MITPSIEFGRMLKRLADIGLPTGVNRPPRMGDWYFNYVTEQWWFYNGEQWELA